MAGVLWGFGFVAAAWSLQAAGPLAITGWRFVIAGIVGLVLFRRGVFQNIATLGPLAVLPGCFISLTLILQTAGLRTTTATKSAFITCLYVLIVPILETLIHRKQPSRRLILSGIVALLGVAMMCGLTTDISIASAEGPLPLWTRGDSLTLLCALAASIHILLVDRVTRKQGPKLDSFAFNTLQSFCAGLPALILSLPFFGIEHSSDFPLNLFASSSATARFEIKPLIGFLSLTFGSTMIAFALQIRAQKVIPPSLASLLFLLESPSAALFAFLLLDEPLGAQQIFGGTLIITAIIFGTRRASTA